MALLLFALPIFEAHQTAELVLSDGKVSDQPHHTYMDLLRIIGCEIYSSSKNDSESAACLPNNERILLKNEVNQLKKEFALAIQDKSVYQ